MLLPGVGGDAPEEELTTPLWIAARALSALWALASTCTAAASANLSRQASFSSLSMIFGPTLLILWVLPLWSLKTASEIIVHPILFKESFIAE